MVNLGINPNILIISQEVFLLSGNKIEVGSSTGIMSDVPKTSNKAKSCFTHIKDVREKKGWEMSLFLWWYESLNK